VRPLGALEEEGGEREREVGFFSLGVRSSIMDELDLGKNKLFFESLFLKKSPFF